MQKEGRRVTVSTSVTAVCGLYALGQSERYTTGYVRPFPVYDPRLLPLSLSFAQLNSRVFQVVWSKSNDEALSLSFT